MQTDPLIKQARVLLEPSPVKSGLPRWFRQRLPKAFGPMPRSLSGTGFLRSVCESRGWIDHVGQTIDQGRQCFCCEPYRLAFADILEIERLAEMLDCEWTISSNSWHYPGKTLRVLLWPQEDVES